MTKETTEQLANLGGECFDLAGLDTRKIESAACEIMNKATGASTGAKVWLFPMDHEKVQAYINQRANEQMRLEASQRARGKEPNPPTVERGVERTIELLCVATDRWENLTWQGERDASFDIQKAKALYAVPQVREQLTEFIGELENFIKG